MQTLLITFCATSGWKLSSFSVASHSLLDGTLRPPAASNRLLPDRKEEREEKLDDGTLLILLICKILLIYVWSTVRWTLVSSSPLSLPARELRRVEAFYQRWRQLLVVWVITDAFKWQESAGGLKQIHVCKLFTPKEVYILVFVSFFFFFYLHNFLYSLIIS